MVIEIDPNLIYLVIAVSGAAGGAVGWIFRRGREKGTEEACIKRIENTLDGLDKKLDKEIKDTSESHRVMHGRIDKLAQDVAYIKGKVDNHIDENRQ